MKALTICQPHAHLIVGGLKRVENRTWSTSYRGPLAIHAGKSQKYFRGSSVEQVFACYGAAAPNELVFGAIIGVCDLIDIVPESDVFDDYPEICPATFVEGPECWILANVRALAKPIACNGRLGLWTPGDMTIKAIIESVVHFAK